MLLPQGASGGRRAHGHHRAHRCLPRGGRRRHADPATSPSWSPPSCTSPTSPACSAMVIAPPTRRSIGVRTSSCSTASCPRRRRRSRPTTTGCGPSSASTRGSSTTNCSSGPTSGGLESVDRFTVGAGDVRTLDPSTIHSVQARGDRYLGAIHVYGGDLFGTPRSTWRDDVEYPMDESALPAFFDRLRRHETELGRAMTPDEVATFLAGPSAPS